ncbi:DUF1294 domain-containing protein [Phenylobacterium sp. LH3H17]|uniref:DUF1294 domain-containing protein n=1 Tax=Phenylobacterium sp. LH3H17 TaxID=2903901 RepID=UPI0020CA1727|nr:DUF1294 domain-containing protein [Phenylobacterium sp. LH3H17]UTP38938.1 DUF1294 domain-containing protein [Phenylobacterium sp. LH3H17]
MILPYLALVNFAAFAAMGWDKARAERGDRRIPERTLLTLAAIGGSLGALAAQQAFRHKTRKQPFGGILLVILAAQAVIAAFLILPAD